MGRHSRRGRADKVDSSKVDRETVGKREAPELAGVPAAGAGTGPSQDMDWAAGSAAQPVAGSPGPLPSSGGMPAQGGFPAPGGMPVQGGFPFPDVTPAHGMPRFPDGTPAHGMPRFPDGTPAHGFPQVRGGHPEPREPGGGWGQLRNSGPQGFPQGAPQGSVQGAPQGFAQGAPTGVPQGVAPAARPGPRIPAQRQTSLPGPRQAYVDAFGGPLGADRDVFAPRTGTAPRADPYGSVTDWDTDADEKPLPEAEQPGKGRNGKGRAFTGIAAAAVTTVLAVVVAGQVASGRDDVEDSGVQAQSTSGVKGVFDAPAAPTPSVTASAATLTYDEKMNQKYALGATLDGSGKFDAVPGLDKAPGKGQKYTYRVDVEQGLGLDSALFAQAVQKTLNDDRSWAHNDGRTFERISSGKPDFVITLASPGTTAEWCAKSGLDTTEDNVSCDSASTERVMINAYRWAQGSVTYGDKMLAYRQMLINHEIGHRLGYSHVTCDKDGELAPVMQQQTKFLDHDGIHCKANPWPYPGS